VRLWLAAAVLILPHGCSTSMRADLAGSVERTRLSALRVLKELDAEPVAPSDSEVTAVLKDGKPVRILLESLSETGTRVQVTVGRGESPEEVAEAVRIIEKMADGVDR
jgi:hypothetical protein